MTRKGTWTDELKKKLEKKGQEEFKPERTLETKHRPSTKVSWSKNSKIERTTPAVPKHTTDEIRRGPPLDWSCETDDYCH